MDALKKVTNALEIVDVYSDYLYRKAWGRVLILWGILLSFLNFFVVNKESISEILNLDELLTQILIYFVMIIALGLTLLNFLSVTRFTKRIIEPETSEIHDGAPYHAILISLTWFLLFSVVNFIPIQFQMVSINIVAGIACVISYFLLKKSHGQFPEIMLVGLILLITSIPLLVLSLSNELFAQMCTLLIFTLSFIIGGIYSMTIANKILNTKVDG